MRGPVTTYAWDRLIWPGIEVTTYAWMAVEVCRARRIYAAPTALQCVTRQAHRDHARPPESEADSLPRLLGEPTLG